MRSHSQAFTIKLRSDVPIQDVESILDGANDWVHVVHNDVESTRAKLSPTAVTGSLDVPIGRIRKLRLGEDYLGAFTVATNCCGGQRNRFGESSRSCADVTDRYPHPPYSPDHHHQAGQHATSIMSDSPYRSFREQSVHYFTRDNSGLPHASIESPANWRGPKMREHESAWRFELEPAELEELDRELSRLRGEDISLESITRSGLHLPRLSERCQGWQAALMNGCGFVVVSGLPVEAWSESRSAMAFWAIGHQLGLPGAQNPDNELLGHVTDYGEQRDSPNVRLYRTPSNINFHCDAADVVGLLCLQTALRGGQSRIASSVAIWNALYEEDEALAETLFERFALDLRGEHRPGQPGHAKLQPCSYGKDGVLRTFYHSEYFRSAERLEEIGSLPARHMRLLDRYDALAGSPEFHLDMWLKPGDMQFISNHTIVHARTAYEDDEDPARKRHLLRLWLSLDAAA